jgi:hypothetical protein
MDTGFENTLLVTFLSAKTTSRGKPVVLIAKSTLAEASTSLLHFIGIPLSKEAELTFLPNGNPIWFSIEILRIAFRTS